MKVALYTANFGGIDVVRPMPRGELFESYYLTDNRDERGNNADHVIPYDFGGGNHNYRKMAKHVKLCPWATPEWVGLRDHDVSIWVDASADIHDGDAFVKMATSRLPLGLWKHPDRDNIVDEISLSRQLHKYAGVRFDAQLSAYGNSDALWATGVIVRDHNDPLVRSAMEMWWAEMTKYDSWQDQVSLPYVLAETGLVPNAFPESLWSNQWVGWANHLHHD